MIMKHFLASTFLASLLAFSAGPAQAQEEGSDFTPMVLVGALSASVTLNDVEFANLPSGMVIRTGPNGVEVLDPADVPEIDPSVPRVDSGAVTTLSEGERLALTQRFERSLDQLMTAYDQDVVSEDDVITIVKFLLAVQLPWDEVTRRELVDRFGPAVDPDADPVEEAEQNAVQVTDPIDTTNDYFTPGG